jgi:hypothetical protein
MADKEDSKIRENRLTFAKFVFGDYAQYMHDMDKLADVALDLVYSGLTDTPARHEVNRATIAEAYEYMRTARGRQPVYPRMAQAGVPRPAAPRQLPDKVAMLKYAQSLGIPQLVFEDWWAYGESTGWIYKAGTGIKSLHASLKGFFKKSQEQEKDSPPETA